MRDSGEGCLDTSMVIEDRGIVVQVDEDVTRWQKVCNGIEICGEGVVEKIAKDWCGSWCRWPEFISGIVEGGTD